MVLPRITPACAGIRRSKTSPGLSSWDHPRVRGDKGVFEQEDEYAEGSPPRARG